MERPLAELADFWQELRETEVKRTATANRECELAERTGNELRFRQTMAALGREREFDFYRLLEAVGDTLETVTAPNNSQI